MNKGAAAGGRVVSGDDENGIRIEQGLHRLANATVKGFNSHNLGMAILGVGRFIRDFGMDMDKGILLFEGTGLPESFLDILAGVIAVSDPACLKADKFAQPLIDKTRGNGNPLEPPPAGKILNCLFCPGRRVTRPFKGPLPSFAKALLWVCLLSVL